MNITDNIKNMLFVAISILSLTSIAYLTIINNTLEDKLALAHMELSKQQILHDSAIATQKQKEQLANEHIAQLEAKAKEKLNNINNFTRRDNESDCDSAMRFFSTSH